MHAKVHTLDLFLPAFFFFFFFFFFFLSLYFTSQGSTIQATYIFLLRLLLDANTNCKKSGGGPAWYKVLMLVDPFCDR